MRGRTFLIALALTLWGSGAALAQTKPVAPCQFLPIVLDVEASGTRYLTELSFTNANAESADVVLRYTAALGSADARTEARMTVLGGAQVMVPDAISFLRGLGMGIAAAPAGGTLLVCSPPNASGVPLGVVARVTAESRPPFPAGKAGVSFLAVPAEEGFTTRATVFGLRSDTADRSNVSVYNPAAEPVTVTVTLISGTGDDKVKVVAENEELAPYGWKQYSNIFEKTGLTQGWVQVERTSAKGVFGAYGVINDNATNDGSFIPATPDSIGGTAWTLPVLVDTPAYRSELVLTNRGGLQVGFSLEYTESLAGPVGPQTRSTIVTVPARRQVIVPDAFALFAETHGTQTSAGTLRIHVLGPLVRDVFVGVRVLTRQDTGRFGVFTNAVSSDGSDAEQGFIWGLRADGLTRSNVAVLNSGEKEDGPVTLQLQAFNGAGTGPAGIPLQVTLEPGAWLQPEAFFQNAGILDGYVRIVRVEGKAPWSAYGVLNDGGSPGFGTGDGSFIPVCYGGKALRLGEGVWGARGVLMEVTAAGAHLEFDCGRGDINGVIFLDPKGQFNGGGFFTEEGGPDRSDGSRTKPMFYVGKTLRASAADILGLTGTAMVAEARQGFEIKLAHGYRPNLVKCL